MIPFFYSINNIFAHFSYNIYFKKCNGNVLDLKSLDLSTATCNIFDHLLLLENYPGLWNSIHQISHSRQSFFFSFFLLTSFSSPFSAINAARPQFSLSSYFHTVHKQSNQRPGSLYPVCVTHMYTLLQCIPFC